MALMKCQECGKEFSSSARSCPACGWRRPRRIFRRMLVGLAVFCALLVILVKITDTPEGREKARLRAAIDLCWKEQQRKSIDSSTARIMAGVCEGMESDFRKRYGHNP